MPFSHLQSGLFDFYAILHIFFYVVYFFFVTIFSINKNRKHKENFNFIPLIVTFFAAITITYFIYAKYEFKDIPTNLVASRQVEKDGIKAVYLTLRINNTYKVESIYVGGHGIYRGNYKTINDTLFLENEIEKETKGIVIGKYLIDKEKSILYPVVESKILQDTTKYLKIENSSR